MLGELVWACVLPFDDVLRAPASIGPLTTSELEPELQAARPMHESAARSARGATGAMRFPMDGEPPPTPSRCPAPAAPRRLPQEKNLSEPFCLRVRLGPSPRPRRRVQRAACSVRTAVSRLAQSTQLPKCGYEMVSFGIMGGVSLVRSWGEERVQCIIL